MDVATIWDDLCDYAETTRAARRVPGMAVGILHRDRVDAAGFGVTNVDHPLEVTDETLFQIGSITKTYTGTLMMLLVEQGKLDLDASIRTYVPDFQVADDEASSHATVRHLLTHMGGWVGDFFHDTGSGDDASARYVADMTGLAQLAPLGTIWSYNNAGFYVAGHIIERILEKPYSVVMDEMLFQPLGLSHSFFDASDVMTYRFAVGHRSSSQGPQVARPWPLPRAAYAAGAITCHVRALLTYAQLHLHGGVTEGGQRLLAEETIKAMHVPEVTVWGKAGWGLSWSVDDTWGVRMLAHGGATTGQAAHLLLVPEHDFVFAALTNSDTGRTAYRAVMKRALQEYLGVTILEPEPMRAAPEELMPYVGRYQRPFAEIELGLLCGRLVGQMVTHGGFPTEDTPPPPPPAPMVLDLCEKDRLVVVDGPFRDDAIDVVRKEDGTIGWLRMGSRLYPRQDGD